MGKVKRNDPCPCGSGKKYKKCCGSIPAPAPLSDDFVKSAIRFEQLGQLDLAIERYEQIVKQQPNNVDVLCRLGKLTLDLGHVDSGLAYLEKAYSSNLRDYNMVFTYAAQLLQTGGVEQAVAVLTKALKQRPGQAQLMMLLGICYERLSRYNEAIKVLKKALETVPGEPRILTPLALCYRRTGAYAQAESLLDSFTNNIKKIEPGMDVLWSELGMVKDKLGKFDQAFKAFTLSGQLTLAKAEAQALDSSLRDKEIDIYQQWVCDGGLTRTVKTDAREKRTLVFLVGIPRSGTTLTEQVLSSHPQIESSEEKLFLAEVWRSLQSRFDPSKPITEILELCTEQDFERARDAYWNQAEKYFDTDARVLIDKLPLNLISLPVINAVFPSARVIVALRDPRDVCLSCFFQSFRLNLSMKKFLNWSTTTAFYHKVMGYWLAIKPHINLPWIEIKYEDTVDDLPGQVRTILDFIGIEWDESVLNYGERARDKYVATPSYQAIREPVHKGSVQRWKNYPDATAAGLADLRPFIDEFGYSLEQSA